jgi:hypothetical protein
MPLAIDRAPDDPDQIEGFVLGVMNIIKGQECLLMKTLLHTESHTHRL